jgi:small subunit ribosomal protein S6
MLKKYESMVIVAPTLTEEGVKQIVDKFQSFIKENGGEIITTDEWGKKQLAYEINDHREGFYLVNHFTFDPNMINELDRMMKLNESIIRHNILAK